MQDLSRSVLGNLKYLTVWKVGDKLQNQNVN